MSSQPVVQYKNPAFTILLTVYVLVPNVFFLYELISGVPKDSLQILTENCMAAFYLFFLYNKHERIVLFTRAIALIFGIGYLLLFIGLVGYNAVPLVKGLSESSKIWVAVFLGVLLLLSIFIFVKVNRFIVKTK